MLLQLNPVLKVLTPLGPGVAVIYEDDGEEIWWTVFLANQAIVQFPNNKIKAARCYSFGRGLSDTAMRKIISAAK